MLTENLACILFTIARILTFLNSDLNNINALSDRMVIFQSIPVKFKPKSTLISQISDTLICTFERLVLEAITMLETQQYKI